MFQNDRYVTCGVATSISFSLQMLLWYLVDSMEVEEKDYLQVLQLEAYGDKQKIIHMQENPPYRKEHLLSFGETSVKAKLFLIDDEDHSTMLLADEY